MLIYFCPEIYNLQSTIFVVKYKKPLPPHPACTPFLVQTVLMNSEITAFNWFKV